MQNILRILFYLFNLIVLALPLYLIKETLQFNNSSELLFLLHRIFGLYAFSLIFLQIILGSGRPILAHLFPSYAIINFHQSSGKIAFLFAFLHPILLLSTYFTESNLGYVTSFLAGDMSVYFWTGVIAYFALFVSVGAAIFRRYIGPNWVYFHRLNYLIFWLIFFHSFQFGLDVHSDLGQGMYLVYGTIVGALTLRKFFAPKLFTPHIKVSNSVEETDKS